MNKKAVYESTQIHRVLLHRMGLVMLLFTLERIVFFLANKDLFQETTFSGFMLMLGGGTRFDLAALLYINALFILSQVIPFKFRYHELYQKVATLWFFVTNGFFLSMNISDTIYYRFIYKRTTSSVIGNFANETNLGKLFFRFIFIDYWYMTLLFVALVYAMIRFYKIIEVKKPVTQKPVVYYYVQGTLMLVIIYFTIIGMRGGFTGTTRPITLSNAGRYVERPKEMAIVLNTPFTIFKTFDQPSLERKNYFPEHELTKIYTPVHHPQPDSAFRKKNVVIFILESFGREYIGRLNHQLDGGHYKGYTPFVDSLIDHSLTFRYSFANGGKSIDGIPSVISSIPSLQGSFVLSNYATNETPSLAKDLRQKGYHTAFFHGAPNGSMGFLAYTTVNGYQEYYGKSEYNNNADYDGIWGIWDEEFFQFMNRTLTTFNEPFLATIFSVSSHHPFKVPERYKDKFPKGELPMHQVIGYTDFALQKFFEAASKEPWYKNTLFVLTADHTNQSNHREFQTALGIRAVPIIFFDPAGNRHGIIDKVAQQIDIAPTVLGYLNYDLPYFAFGRDLLDENLPGFAISTMAGYYQVAAGDYVIASDGNTSPTLYNFKEDPLMMNNLVEQRPTQKDSLEQFTRAFLQQYNNRMIDNRLTVENK